MYAAEKEADHVHETFRTICSKSCAEKATCKALQLKRMLATTGQQPTITTCSRPRLLARALTSNPWRPAVTYTHTHTCQRSSRISCLSPRLLSASVVVPSAPQYLTEWLHLQDPLQGPQNVSISVSASTGGRQLTALSDIPADAPLLSVPLCSVFSDIDVSQLLLNPAKCSMQLSYTCLSFIMKQKLLQRDEDTHLPWSARMALRLLHQKMLCQGDTADQDGLLCPWIAALPRQVSSPCAKHAAQLSKQLPKQHGPCSLCAQCQQMCLIACNYLFEYHYAGDLATHPFH